MRPRISPPTARRSTSPMAPPFCASTAPPPRRSGGSTAPSRRCAACRTAASRSRSTGARCRCLRRLRHPTPSVTFTDLSINAVNALSPGAGETLIATNGSTSRPYGQWVHDLMERGRTGKVLSLDHRQRHACARSPRGWLTRLARAPLEMAVLVSESWRHRVIAHRPGRKPARGAGQSAGLSFAAVSGSIRRFLAHGVRGAHATGRIRAARECLPAAHDGGNRSGILDRAEAEIRPVVSRADAGRAYQDHGRGQAMGAAAILWPCDPARTRAACRSTRCTAGSTASTMASSRRSKSMARCSPSPRGRAGCCACRSPMIEQELRA